MTPQPSASLREQIENTLRFLAVDAIEEASCGHPGAPMALAGPAFELWNNHLRFDPTDPEWPLRDRFVLSNGHASMLQYGLLHLFGYDLSIDDIRNFRKLGSKTPGHPEYGDTPGVELTTGPLGQGVGNAVGIALAQQMARARFSVDGQGPGHSFVYCIAGDGDLMEGIASEAASFAGTHALGNLICLYDDNQISIDGPTSITFQEDVSKRFEAYGWQILSVDGEDHAALSTALKAAREETARPSLVVMRTTIGLGSPNRAGKSKAHGEKLGEEELALTKEAMGWPLEPRFRVPDDVRAFFDECIAAKRAQRGELDAALETWRSANPERAAAWDSARAGELPEDLAEQLCAGRESVDDATRKHSAASLETLAKAVPYLVGGSADLAGSAAPPNLKGRGTVGPGAEEGEDPFAGCNIHFGVREHAMGAIANGIALEGTFRPYCGTFLIFSDYMRPSIRLAALMGVPTIFVFTHDSIFLGEDGPTHQPIEQLDALRAIPNLPVFRPADGIETAMAYAYIARRKDGPGLLSLTRQGVPALERPAGFTPQDVLRGAYAVREPGDATKVVLLASGSEVSLACDAAAKLEADGLSARVVSVPCLDLFLEQPDTYRSSLVPTDGTPVVAVEAGRGLGFHQLLGPAGRVYGIDRFGASAPHRDLAEEFGFTPDQLVATVRDLVARTSG
ncbi:transketolase [Myxococcota bacterium]|nr:transketolase [Myxococcota bacterium]